MEGGVGPLSALLERARSDESLEAVQEALSLLAGDDSMRDGALHVLRIFFLKRSADPSKRARQSEAEWIASLGTISVHLGQDVRERGAHWAREIARWASEILAEITRVSQLEHGADAVSPLQQAKVEPLVGLLVLALSTLQQTAPAKWETEHWRLLALDSLPAWLGAVLAPVFPADVWRAACARLSVRIAASADPLMPLLGACVAAAGPRLFVLPAHLLTAPPLAPPTPPDDILYASTHTRLREAAVSELALLEPLAAQCGSLVTHELDSLLTRVLTSPRDSNTLTLLLLLLSLSPALCELALPAFCSRLTRVAEWLPAVLSASAQDNSGATVAGGPPPVPAWLIWLSGERQDLVARLQLAGPWVELLAQAAQAGAHAATAVLTHLSCRLWRDHLHSRPSPFARALRSHLRPLISTLLSLAEAPRSDRALLAALVQLLQLVGEHGGSDAREDLLALVLASPTHASSSGATASPAVVYALMREALGAGRAGVEQGAVERVLREAAGLPRERAAAVLARVRACVGTDTLARVLARPTPLALLLALMRPPLASAVAPLLLLALPRLVRSAPLARSLLRSLFLRYLAHFPSPTISASSNASAFSAELADLLVALTSAAPILVAPLLELLLDFLFSDASEGIFRLASGPRLPPPSNRLLAAEAWEFDETPDGALAGPIVAPAKSLLAETRASSRARVAGIKRAAPDETDKAATALQVSANVASAMSLLARLPAHALTQGLVRELHERLSPQEPPISFEQYEAEHAFRRPLPERDAFVQRVFVACPPLWALLDLLAAAAASSPEFHLSAAPLFPLVSSLLVNAIADWQAEVRPALRSPHLAPTRRLLALLAHLHWLPPRLAAASLLLDLLAASEVPPLLTLLLRYLHSFPPGAPVPTSAHLDAFESPLRTLLRVHADLPAAAACFAVFYAPTD